MTRVEEQQRNRVREDLKGIIKGEMLFDDVTLSLYSTDASIFQVMPAGVVAPLDEEDVRGLVRYASDTGTPLIARGAGTGVAGESLGKGLILDLSRHFRNIVEVGADTVRVQPGVTYRALNERLATVGRRFAPDPASGAVCTIGGMLANNASGSHALRHGYTRDHVQSLRVVLDTGDVCATGQEAWPPSPDSPPGHFLDILNALGVLLEQNHELIAHHHPGTRFDRCGYQLKGVRGENTIDVPRLLIGSEGTLGLFTEATLRTVPLPEGRSVVLLSFASLEAALRATQQILPTGPAACELMDRRLLSLARGSDAARVAQLVPAAAEAVLLIEFETDTAAEAQSAARTVANGLLREGEGLLAAVPAFAGEALDKLWQLREVALPSLYGLKGGAQPVPFVEDIGVPLPNLSEFMRRVQEVLQEQETIASFLIHAGAGQVHTRPFLNLQDPGDVSKLNALAENIHALALELGGTISTQHGTGLARTPWVARQFGPLYPVLRQVKAIFDPKNIFNPGKIVDPEPSLASWPLRKLAGPAPQPSTLHLRWQPEQVGLETNQCNGCGQCRTESTHLRMCPIFRATQAEAASPRAKANLLRGLINEPGGALASDQVREVADLCVNCKMCAVECPAHVNIPKLMLETKAANVAQHGLDRTAWFLSRLETFAWIGSPMARVSNRVLSSYTLRWLLDKLLGLSSRRRLPTLAKRSFLRQARRRGWTDRPRSSRPCVALYVDTFANYFDPLVAEAAVVVLQHNGFDVFVPAGQGSCGMAPLAHGDIETAREQTQRNLRALVEVARDNMPIVCLEPTSTLMFRQDVLDLLDDEDARMVAKQVVDLTAFLEDLLHKGRLKLDFLPLELSLGHHVPCHTKALGQASAAPALLQLIPELRVQTIDVGCSGMAGTYGLQARNYLTSLSAGRAMLEELSKPRILFGSTECSSCRLQMEDAAGKRTLHPVQYLALGYGLLPEVAERLKKPLGELVL